MFTKFYCTCGNPIHAWEGMEQIRCPVCGVMSNMQTQPGPADRTPGFVVFGVSQPPPSSSSVPQVELKYNVVQVGEEQTPPQRQPPVSRARRGEDEDDPRMTYDVVEVARENGQKTLEEMWDPDADVRPPWTRYKPRYKYRRFRATWPLEQHWFECLLFPFRAILLVGGLGFALALFSLGVLQLFHHQGYAAVFFLPFWLATLGYASGFFTCVFRSGMCGETLVIRWPAADFALVARSLFAALLTFVAGPIFLFWYMVEYWIQAGQMDALDRFLLLQLLFVAVGWWLLAFLSVSRGHRWRDLDPRIVLKRANELGYRAAAAVVFVFLLALFFGTLSLVALENPGTGGDVILLIFSSVGSMFFLTFIFRWLGVRIHLSKEPSPRPSEKTPMKQREEARDLDCRWIDV